MPWTWDTTVEAIKVVGGLGAATFALYQYSHQLDQDRGETVRHAIEITHDETAKEFRKELLLLIEPFDAKDQHKFEVTKEFYIWDSNPKDFVPPSEEFYDRIVLSNHDYEYEFVATFLRQMYRYAASNACTWDVVVDGFRQDAGNFWYYFEPTWDQYAKKIRKDPTGYWEPICAIVWNERPAGMASHCQEPWYPQLLSRDNKRADASSSREGQTDITHECRRSRLYRSR
jgi:hypothetical protein